MENLQESAFQHQAERWESVDNIITSLPICRCRFCEIRVWYLLLTSCYLAALLQLCWTNILLKRDKKSLQDNYILKCRLLHTSSIICFLWSLSCFLTQDVLLYLNRNLSSIWTSVLPFKNGNSLLGECSLENLLSLYRIHGL